MYPVMQNPWAWPMQTLDELTATQARRIAYREQARRRAAQASTLGFVRYFHPDYQAGWVHKELCDIIDAFIEAVEQRKSPRLIVSFPPRHGKSTIISEHAPPYILGKHPDWDVVTATYGQDMADIFGRGVRRLLNDPRYTGLFPGLGIDTTSNAADRVGTFPLATVGRPGGYRAVGIGGALTGTGAHVLLIDDPVKDREAADSELISDSTWSWYTNVARTRLHPGGGIIVVQTRWHENDLTGRLLDQSKQDKSADQWMQYVYPAVATKDEAHRLKGEPLHPERYSLDELAALRASMTANGDARGWNSLYQQQPIPDEGTFFKRDWLENQWFKDPGSTHGRQDKV